MNNIRIKVYKKPRGEICKKYDGARDFTDDKIEDTCSLVYLLSDIRFFI